MAANGGSSLLSIPVHVGNAVSEATVVVVVVVVVVDVVEDVEFDALAVAKI